MVWKPNVTVAAVIERDGSFLLVEEKSENRLVYNQPAGHLEPHESLVQGAIRETLEETGYHFAPTALVGIYQWHSTRKGVTYLRFAFTGPVTGHEPERPLDAGIVRATWLPLDAIRSQPERHRSPLVLRCIEDYLSGKRYPLDIVSRCDGPG